MDNNPNQTPKDLSLDRLDEITWRAIAALSQTRLTVEHGEEVVIVARISRGNIQATAVAGGRGNLTVSLHPEGIEVFRACEFCARTAIGRTEMAPGRWCVVCKHCGLEGMIEPLDDP